METLPDVLTSRLYLMVTPPRIAREVMSDVIACLALRGRVNGEARDPERYSGIMARFIEATYKPIQEVFHSVEVEETN